MTTWDPDGSGPFEEVFVVGGGQIQVAGIQVVSNVFSWNGNYWAPLGTPGWTVRSLGVFEDKLIAGGTTGNVKRWSGAIWQDLGTPFGDLVRTLCVFNNELYAGGYFTPSGNPSGVKRWTGTSWVSVGGNFNGTVAKLFVYKGELLVAGGFTGGISRWTGSTWQLIGGGMSGGVGHLLEHEGDLIAAGGFLNAGGAPASRVARWDGVAWQPMGAGFDSIVSAMTTWQGKLVGVDSGSPMQIKYWDNIGWQQMPSSLANTIIGSPAAFGIATFKNDLFIAGRFNIPGWNIARYNEAENRWKRVGRGMNEYVYTAAQHGGDLYLGGRFITAGAVDAARVVRFDGVDHHPLGSGVDNWVFAILPFRDDVIVGGYFSTAGGIPVNGIARWNKKTGWSDMAGGLGGAPGALPPSAFALAIYEDDLIVGGNFTTAGGVPANFIARWDGANWHPVGSGMGGNSSPTIATLTVHNGELIAGGFFTAAGGEPANRIARWNGTQWSALAGGMNGGVLALCTHNGELFAGGGFNEADGNARHGLARWTGTTWAGMNTGSPSIVYALASYDGDLIVGGYMQNHAWSPNFSDQIARWRNGTWSLMGTGVEPDIARALTIYKNELIVGGQFIKAGGKAAGYWARWRPECPRGDMDCDQAVNEAYIATFVSVLLAPAAATDCQRYLADVTADGDVNGADVSAFVAALKM